MEKLTSKQRTKPTFVCQYGKNCYRKNPHHFMEYTHEHLEKIMKQNTTHHLEQFKIPDELISHKELIIDQIKIIEELFPTNKSNEEPLAKKNKPDKALAISSHSNESNGVDKISLNSASTSQQSASVSKFDIHQYIKVVTPKGKMKEKLDAAQPFNFFLTSITSSPPTHNEPLSITFQEILDSSLGELESSVQINFMVEIGWLLGQYYFAGCLSKKLLILYGTKSPDLENIHKTKPQVTAIEIKMPTPFATHHTKMMLLGYKDGSMRVVISTANLYEDDWHNRTQGIWISHALHPLHEGSDTAAGESPTEFRNELLKYLSSYKLPQLQPWLVRIRKTNFSEVNVFLVTSIPGAYQSTNGHFAHGHGKVSWLLSKHAAPIEDSSPIVAQSSSLGSFGASPDSWLTSEFVNSFRRDTREIGLRKIPSVRIIYPSFNNVANSHDHLIGGGCLPYGNQTHQKQLWLNDFFYQWRADCRYRTKAMPHIKTYCRWTDKKLFWFILTSANLSKAAWGQKNKSLTNPSLRISNYEAGVLFLPKFVTNTRYFSMDESDCSTPMFPPVYDVPLTKFVVDDTPFLSDILFPTN
ncbi:probable tyrosyl-DNA phosphodiesterase [Contarinia nasturtii]|uniref:probable tyrosyl-DNA phosphodiesterase n=1 Tax=Contarinia nasturtii TaxID=265458 RepID=UPI0012D43C55|nr:probable tyrosyl-DNA phosphodiesterase [Contarinia nasturtii]